jgi:lactate permease
MWTQTFNPLGGLAWSAAVAALPILFLLWALVIRRLPGYVAGLLTIGVALGVAVLAYGMPVKLAVLAALHGACYGLFPIGWIVLAAVILYQVTVRSGQFAIIKQSIAALTDDRRLQALLIAFSFGAFLEGAAGFGTPVAISAGMLVGLGFDARYAAGLCLIANTAPVAFGSIGIPLVTASQVTGLDAFALSQMVGRQLPVLSLILPFYLVTLMAGWRGVKDVWPAALASGASFALAQGLTANYLGPMLPDIVSSVASIVTLVILLRVWHPAQSFRFAHEPAIVARPDAPRAGDALRAWLPFLLLTLFISDWGIVGVQAWLDRVTFRVAVPGLHEAIVNPESGATIAALYRVNWLGAAGTAVFLSAIASALVAGLRPREFVAVSIGAVRQLALSFVTIAAFLAFAFLGTASGMTTTLGRALAATGPAFPFFSPLLGWLGVFITGSDTSANALFGKLQQVTAEQLHMSPVLAVAANSAGGVTGKMISPQSLVVACAAAGLAGREPELLRFTLKHSVLMVAIVGVITWLQATWLQWMVPATVLAGQGAARAQASAGGLWILGGTLLVVLVAARLSRPRVVRS